MFNIVRSSVYFPAIIALCIIAGVSAQYEYNSGYEIGIPKNYFANQPQYNGQYNNGQYNNGQYNNGQYNPGMTGPTKAIADPRCPRTDDPMRPVHLPFAGNCGKFLKCTGGLGFIMDCPAGLEYAVRTNRCDYPAVAQCRS
uniref:Chitin-binding type-2 domain-containing protein n=1 Tax=Anopheles culicifacies TaxID=139723 RepID=A0A182LUN0_9DIPT